MGVLDTYSNVNFTTMNRPTGRGRFSKYDYTASFQDKAWNVTRNNVGIVASENNSNTSSVNKQLASDWIENDWKKRKAIEAGNEAPLDPGLANPNYSLPTGTPDDSENTETIPDTSTSSDDSEVQIEGFTDNQRFLLIGVVVASALLGFIKR